VVLVFAVVTLLWSRHVDVGLRDPHGRLFRDKLTGAVLLFLGLAVLDVLVRTVRAGWSAARLREQVLLRWDVRRLAVLLSAIVAYHVVYLCYRNLKSWDAFNTPRDHDLLAVDRALFFGHSPASVVQGLLGRSDTMAGLLAHVYEAFPQLVSLAIVAAPAFVTRTRRGMVMLTAGMWAWILGTISYYAIPSLGPCYSAATDFLNLPHTVITDNQAHYLTQRITFLADPSNPRAFVSISAFASLHVGLTCMITLMAAYYRKRVLTVVLAVYLVMVMFATVYFGWHFFVDVVAGVVLAFASVALGHLTVHPGVVRSALLSRGRSRR
jgi:membrane-associated phospholipid phosphatase